MSTMEQDPQDELVHPFVDRLRRAGDHILHHYVTRPVTTITDKDGQKFKASVTNIETPDQIDDPSNVEVRLLSHKNKKIIVTAGALLTAAAAVYIARNRSQRKKMPKNKSSFIRKKSGKRKLPG